MDEHYVFGLGHIGRELAGLRLAQMQSAYGVRIAPAPPGTFGPPAAAPYGAPQMQPQMSEPEDSDMPAPPPPMGGMGGFMQQIMQMIMGFFQSIFGGMFGNLFGGMGGGMAQPQPSGPPDEYYPQREPHLHFSRGPALTREPVRHRVIEENYHPSRHYADGAGAQRVHLQRHQVSYTASAPRHPSVNDNAPEEHSIRSSTPRHVAPETAPIASPTAESTGSYTASEGFVIRTPIPLGRFIGRNQQCAALPQAYGLPHTSTLAPGTGLTPQTAPHIEKGTVIGSFDPDGVYRGQHGRNHLAVYVGPVEDGKGKVIGAKVIDQWGDPEKGVHGQPAHERTLYFGNHSKPVNDPGAFAVVIKRGAPHQSTNLAASHGLPRDVGEKQHSHG